MKEKMKRNERVAAISRVLTDAPMQVFTLSHFCSLFDAAKSTISEDIDLLRQVFSDMQLGSLETITGAAGGVFFIPELSGPQSRFILESLCKMLSAPDRVLSGGLLYIADILGSPQWMHQLGMVLADAFRPEKPDFVLTVETSGICIALMTARALGVPLVLARRGATAYEGSVVTINYRAGTSGIMQTMSLSRRAVKPGQRALIVDDFMRAGGSAQALTQLMAEFEGEIAGVGVLLMTKEPEQKLIRGAKALMTVEERLGEEGFLVTPSQWIGALDSKGEETR